MAHTIINHFSQMKEMLSVFGSISVMAAGFAGIIILMFIAFKIPGKHFAVITAIFGSCILMIPVITAFNTIVDKKALASKSNELRTEIALKKTELALLEQKKINEKQQIVNTRHAIELNALESQKRLLEHAQLSISNYTEISEVNLLETNVKQTSVNRKVIKPLEIITGTKGFAWWKEEYDKAAVYDEALSIVTHDIQAKFGFDIQALRFSESDDQPDTVFVSGLMSKFTGKIKDRHKKELSEIRRVWLNPADVKNVSGSITDGKTEKILHHLPDMYYISIDSRQKGKALEYADECILRFNKRLEQGIPMPFMEDAVKTLSEKFLRLMLAPLEKDIVFVSESPQQGVPLDEYLKAELHKLEMKKNEIKKSRTNTVFTEIDTEIAAELKNKELQ